MLSSLGCGLDALPSEVHAVLAFPVDHPDVLPGTVAALIEACSMEGGGLWAPVYEGRSGHPVVVWTRLLRDLPREDLPGGLAAWLRACGLRWRGVSVNDPGILRNRNTIG
jgi:CTP:molybdopterin cytidylyltransferase MocA